MDSKRSLKGTDNVLVFLGFEDAEKLTAMPLHSVHRCTGEARVHR